LHDHTLPDLFQAFADRLDPDEEGSAALLEFFLLHLELKGKKLKLAQLLIYRIISNFIRTKQEARGNLFVGIHEKMPRNRDGTMPPEHYRNREFSRKLLSLLLELAYMSADLLIQLQKVVPVERLLEKLADPPTEDGGGLKFNRLHEQESWLTMVYLIFLRKVHLSVGGGGLSIIPSSSIKTWKSFITGMAKASSRSCRRCGGGGNNNNDNNNNNNNNIHNHHHNNNNNNNSSHVV